MAKKNFSLKPFSAKVKKPWGYEIVITSSQAPATGKIAFTQAGRRWSLQYHQGKTETISLIAGKAKLILEDNQGQLLEIEMEPFKGYLISPEQKHRLQAKTDSLTLEVSSPEKKAKTIRIEDDYGRKNETEKEREEMRKS